MLDISICEHNRRKSRCKFCLGSVVCEHQKRKSRCNVCSGSSVCKHQNIQSRCNLCSRSSVCKHQSIKSRCNFCSESIVCEHQRIKSRCKDCLWSGICVHQRIKFRCDLCHLEYHEKYYASKRDKILLRNKDVNRREYHKKYYVTKLKGSIIKKHGCIECKEWPVDQRRGLPHYDGMCFRCFGKKFPNDERVMSRGRVELKVRSYLDSQFPDFVHDQPIHTAHCVCANRRRVDHRRLIGNTLLCVETDENFHRYYNKNDEEARYHDVIMQWGGKLCFVRFNPHKFNLEDRHDHGPPLAERLERLRAEVTRHIGRLERGENSSYLEVWHLYYPEGTEDYYEEQSQPEWLAAEMGCSV